jgi:2,4-dienoyl-CoA reductase-like NADH-dependent reductase (Old Yellow Enzyme family)
MSSSGCNISIDCLKMGALFESSKINGLTLANRFVRSATWEGMATIDGAVTPKLIDLMTALAKGDVGLIITGSTYVCPEGQTNPRQVGIDRDNLMPGLKEMTGAVHAAGGKIVLQLAHGGNFADVRLIHQPPWVVSSFEGLAKSTRREMSVKDIKKIVDSFARGAQRAQSAGFDGVQLHSAHGYLLSQFLSPIFNRRPDEYGGDIRNRVRIHLEIGRAIRNIVGVRYPLLIKMNGRDFAENGLSLEDSVQAAKLLSRAGFDAIELSGGLLTGGALSPMRPAADLEDQESYFKDDAWVFKKEINVPLILVGGMRSIEAAEKIIESSVADYISMSRPFICEPELIKRWKNGDRRRAECSSDNWCYKTGYAGEGIHCLKKVMDEETSTPGRIQQ